MQPALERAVAELVLGRLGSLDDPLEVEAWLARNGVAGADAASFRAELPRWLVYRSLVRSRLVETIGLAIPRTVARLGALFDEYFERFLAERGPRTHYLRDVTVELIDFCAPLWASDRRVPPWALDLARHEALRVLVGSAANPAVRGELPELDLERGLTFVPASRLVRYDFAVQRLNEDENDRSPPDRVPTALFVYRSPEHEVRYLELTPLCATILERLLAGQSMGSAIVGACSSHGVALEPGVLDGTAQVLSDLARRGAVLGASDPAQPAADLPGAARPPTIVESPGSGRG